jgi:ABC-type branched-subunit amino acid transport system ATPase component
VFKALSAHDNLRCGGVSPGDAIALFPELEKCMRTRGGLLSGGEQPMLTLARRCAGSPESCWRTSCRSASRRSSSIACYADRVYVMSRGRLAMTLSAEEARTRLGEIETAYLSGVTVGASAPA